MKRFWTSWTSGYYIDEGCAAPPIQLWITGSIQRGGNSEKDDLTICAVIDDEDESVIESKLRVYFPDLKMRFCTEKPSNYDPSIGGRFSKFENRTKL